MAIRRKLDPRQHRTPAPAEKQKINWNSLIASFLLACLINDIYSLLSSLDVEKLESFYHLPARAGHKTAAQFNTPACKFKFKDLNAKSSFGFRQRRTIAFN